MTIFQQRLTSDPLVFRINPIEWISRENFVKHAHNFEMACRSHTLHANLRKALALSFPDLTYFRGTKTIVDPKDKKEKTVPKDDGLAVSLIVFITAIIVNSDPNLRILFSENLPSQVPAFFKLCNQIIRIGQITQLNSIVEITFADSYYTWLKDNNLEGTIADKRFLSTAGGMARLSVFYSQACNKAGNYTYLDSMPSAEYIKHCSHLGAGTYVTITASCSPSDTQVLVHPDAAYPKSNNMLTVPNAHLLISLFVKGVLLFANDLATEFNFGHSVPPFYLSEMSTFTAADAMVRLVLSCTVTPVKSEASSDKVPMTNRPSRKKQQKSKKSNEKQSDAKSEDKKVETPEPSKIVGWYASADYGLPSGARFAIDHTFRDDITRAYGYALAMDRFYFMNY